MRLYHFPPAPNPARVLCYVNEKGIELERVLVDFRKQEQNDPAFRALNPAGTLPLLVLDDGAVLTESLAIIEYLEECYPEPAMIGRTALERARVREFERFIEFGALLPIIRLVHATNSPLGRPPNPALAAVERERLPGALARIDARIGESPFVLGERPTIADCTLLAAVNFANFGGLEIDAALENLHRWFQSYALRHL